METITFKGKSERIETKGNYKNLEIISCSDKIVTPLIHFIYLDSEDETELLELNFMYKILYTVSICFETVQDHECSITYRLI